MKPLYLLPLALLLAAGCKKDPIKTLPKATQEGKNTMGCLVDGKAWLPKGSSGCLTGCGAVEPVFAFWRRSRTGGGNLTLGFSRLPSKEPKSSVDFFVPSLTQPGAFSLDQQPTPSNGSTNPAYANYASLDETPDRYYLTGPQASGTLTFTRFDTVACIAAGTFSFTGRHAASGQTVQVTEGRFDVRFTKR